MSDKVIYVDSQYGNNAWDGSLEHPKKTLTHAVSSASPGSVIALQEGDGSSYGDVTISKNLTIRSTYGSSVEVGFFKVTAAQVYIEGLYFKSLSKGIEVTNGYNGSVSVKGCSFEDVETGVELNFVNYSSIHQNFFKNFKWGVKIDEAVEVCISSNVFSSGFRSIEVVTVDRLDIWRNTIWGAGNIAPGFIPDENLRIIYRTLRLRNINEKRIQLPGFAVANDYGYDVAMNVVNGPSFDYGTDYTVIQFGSIVSWDGLRLEDEFAENDVVRIMYSEDVDPGGGNAITANNVTDSDSRIDSNSISKKVSDIALGVFFNTPLKVRYNNFYGVTNWYNGASPSDSAGNFSSDPKYTDPVNDDFSLQVISPNIDRGDPERWDQIFTEMGVKGSDPISRENVAPFNRDTDFTGVHRKVLGPTGDIGAYEYNINQGSQGGYVAEDGYDFAYPGTQDEPYATLDRGYSRSGTSDLNVGVNNIPYQYGGVYHSALTGLPLYRYGRYRSKNIDLNNANLNIGEGQEGDIIYVYPSYPSYDTGSVYVSPDGKDSYAGTKDYPFRTIERALQESASNVIVDPGLYPAFKGRSGKKLIGVERRKEVSLSKEIYTNFLDGVWFTTGNVNIARFEQSFTDAAFSESNFTFSSDIDLKLEATTNNDKFTIKLENGSNEVFIVLDKNLSQMIIGYVTDGSTYEFYYPLTGALITQILQNIEIRIDFSDNKISVKVVNSYINESIKFSLGTNYTDPWKMNFSSEGSGNSSARNIYIASTSFTGVSVSSNTVIGKKVFGIKGSS